MCSSKHCSTQLVGTISTYGQNHPAYSFSGCSALCLSTSAFAGPVASGWMFASGCVGMIR